MARISGGSKPDCSCLSRSKNSSELNATIRRRLMRPLLRRSSLRQRAAATFLGNKRTACFRGSACLRPVGAPIEVRRGRNPRLKGFPRLNRYSVQPSPGDSSQRVERSLGALLLSKLNTRVRFPSPAPSSLCHSLVRGRSDNHLRAFAGSLLGMAATLPRSGIKRLEFSGLCR